MRVLLSLFVLASYSALIIGCSGDSTETAATSGDDHDHDHDGDDHDHDGDDHDHDEHDGHDHDGDDHDGHDHGAEGHEGHDHPAHGPNGGHMVELSGGAHAEWAHDDQKNDIMVFVENPETVTKVEMQVTIDGETTNYELKKAEDKPYYLINSPDLLFSVKMTDGVKTMLVVTTADGEASGKVVHHSH